MLRKKIEREIKWLRYMAMSTHMQQINIFPIGKTLGLIIQLLKNYPSIMSSIEKVEPKSNAFVKTTKIVAERDSEKFCEVL